jgi:hypothetical protein
MLVSNYDPLNTTTTTDLGDIMAAYDYMKKVTREHRAREREWRKNATFAEVVDDIRVLNAISLNVFHPFTAGNV